MKIKYLMIILFSFGCTHVKPRKPVNIINKNSSFKNIIKESKQLNKLEELKIKAILDKDTINKYKLSSTGFWYTYKNKVSDSLPRPKKGQTVSFTYNITDLNNSIIYSRKELGIKTYQIDKEDLISGLQYGLKLMKTGETITFVFPFYNAFGSYGDGNKIGINQSIKSTVTLININ